MVDATTEKFIEGFGFLALEEFKLLYNIKDDLERMKNTVSAIRAKLKDAEKKAVNHQVSAWLERLKDVLYDADDVLDDFSTEALTREIMTRNKKAKKVRIFFSRSNQVVYNLKMGRKMREIRKRLDQIYYDKNNLQLTGYPPETPTVYRERKQTYSFVHQDEVIGREDEKNLILHYLLDTNNVKGSSVSVIPIVGIGGLGKTALAQLVYNHDAVQKYFDPKIWVCVSDEFDVRQIAQKILGKEKKQEMEEVQKELRELIQGKRFFIVLDDVWNEDTALWDKLKTLLMVGENGSKIVVTTRSENVAKIMGPCTPVKLEGLDEERSWNLFCRMAFEEGKESKNMQLVAIGKDIVKRCAGVPLAIRTIGSLLYSRNLGEKDWSYFKDCELLKIDEEENKIAAILRLSYDHLPSALKNCFAYCSLFPKDFEIEKRTLIQLWVAEGFIQPSNQIRCEEDVGHEYFMNLLSRSFFQDVKRNRFGDIRTCKMHDLMHDLARIVAGNEYAVISEVKEESNWNMTRHLSYQYDDSKHGWKFPSSFLKSDKLRTMYFFSSPNKSVLSLITPSLNCLRVLVLQGFRIKEIPKNIGKLKHLRYLDLSQSSIYQLPQAITRLHNLQTLKLSESSIGDLPRDINKLVRLRHLEPSEPVQRMPQGLGQLTSLQTLTLFVLDDQENRGRNGSAGISELGGLNNLRGLLRIGGLEHLRANTEEVESTKIQEKRDLEEIELVWRNPTSEDASKDELILEGLHPPHSIKRVLIDGFCGKKLPDWIGNLSSIVRLEIYSCQYLTSMPEGMRNLISLETPQISNCPGLYEKPEDWSKFVQIATNVRLTSKVGSSIRPGPGPLLTLYN